MVFFLINQLTLSYRIIYLLRVFVVNQTYIHLIFQAHSLLLVYRQCWSISFDELHCGVLKSQLTLTGKGGC